MQGNSILLENSGIVYHYTSLDTFMKLLDGVQSGKFMFYGSDIFSMNDTTEFRYGFEQIWDILPNIENELYGNVKKNVDNYDIDIRALNQKYRISRMWGKNDDSKSDEWLGEYIKIMHESFKSPFVISFSCQKDFLPMWSTYGDRGRGVSLGIDVQAYYEKIPRRDGTFLLDSTRLTEPELRSLLVSYDKITMKHPLILYIKMQLIYYLQRLMQVIGNEEELINIQLDTLYNIMAYASALIKNDAYSYEKESRVIVISGSIKNVKFRINESRMIPYIQIGIPVSKLKEVILGPNCDYDTVKHALITRFKQIGLDYNDNIIVHSEIPYRI